MNEYEASWLLRKPYYSGVLVLYITIKGVDSLIERWLGLGRLGLGGISVFVFERRR